MFEEIRPEMRALIYFMVGISLLGIGILLACLALFRRWYAHWAAAFMIALTLNEVIFLFIDNQFNRDRIIVISKKILFILLSAGIFYTLIAGPRLLEIVSKDYSYIAAAFSTYPLTSHITNFFTIFGFYYMILTVSGLLVSLYFKKTRALVIPAPHVVDPFASS